MVSIKRLTKLLHYFTRIVCYHAVLVLPFIVFGLLAYISFDINHPLINIITLMWIILVFLAFMLFIDAFVGKFAFELELKSEAERRLMPISSLRGITIIKKNISRLLFLSFFTFIAIAISFTFYLLSLVLGLLPLVIVATSLILIAFGLAILIKQPKLPVVEIGALLDFYSPIEFKVYIDNMFQDTIPSILDPVSYMKFDDWVDYVRNLIKIPEGVDASTALERAIEKILLMFYLNIKFPKTINDEIVRKEIAELLKNPKDIEKLQKPETETIYDFNDLKKFIDKLHETAPEITLIIDRLFFTLRDNLKQFKTSELFFDVVAPEITKGTNGINTYIFLFNNSEKYIDKPRPIRIRIFAPDFEPNQLSIDLSLDPKGTFKIESNKLPIYAKEGEDIVGKLSEILQIGDGIWIRLIPKNYGTKIITVLIEEQGKIITSRQFSITIKRNITDFLKKIIGSGSILSGIATSILRLAIIP